MRRTLTLVAIGAMALTACTSAWVDEDARQHARRSTPTAAAGSSTSTSPPPAVPATFVEGECPMPVQGDDRQRISCGTLDVALDRSDPTTGRAQVAVAIIASQAAVPQPDPVLYLHGGPGGLALSDYLEWVFPEHPLLADRDLILMDQRGSGWSVPSLNCPAAEEANQPVTALVSCRDELAADGVSLDHFSTADIAADVIDLREALGVERWNLYGISYGTRVALTALDLDGAAVRAAVLDSPYPPEVDAYAEQVTNGRVAIDQLVQACATDARCTGRFGDLSDELDSLLEELADDPVPVELEPGEPRLVVDDATLGSALFSALYDRFTIPDIPLAIQLAVDGDLVTALELLGAADGLRAPTQAEDEQYESLFDAELAFWAPECAEEIETTELRDIVAAVDPAEPIESALVDEVTSAFAVCRRLDIAPVDPVEQGPVESEVPTLMLVGEFDPITPPSWARRAAASLSAAEVVEVVGSGHAPSFEQCPRDALVAFVAAADVPVVVPCLEDMKPLPFSLE